MATGVQAPHRLGPAIESLIVRRDGDLDLNFSGWVLGDGTQTLNNGRQIQVVIYATTGGRIVTEVRRSWGDDAEAQHSAADHPDGSWALTWLKQDNDGSLGKASKTAWLEACAAWPALAEYAVQRID